MSISSGKPIPLSSTVNKNLSISYLFIVMLILPLFPDGKAYLKEFITSSFIIKPQGIVVLRLIRIFSDAQAVIVISLVDFSM